MSNLERPRIQFRMLEIVLAVSVWGNATGLMNYLTRWGLKESSEPNYKGLAVALALCGLWVLEGAWWGLRRENAIRTVTKWTSRWPLFAVGWLRIPLGFIMLMTITTISISGIASVAGHELPFHVAIAMLGILVASLVIFWKWLRFIWKVRAEYDSEFEWSPKRMTAEDLEEEHGRS